VGRRTGATTAKTVRADDIFGRFLAVEIEIETVIEIRDSDYI
jgi:hypothetical protein